MDVRDIKALLANKQFDFSELPVHVSAFCAFVSPWLRKDGYTQCQDASINYRETAARGYRLAVNDGLTDDVEKFIDEVQQLAGRRYFSEGRVPIFEIDGIALLGISLGYKSVWEKLNEVTWFIELLDASEEALKEDQWQRGLVQIARCIATENDIVCGSDILNVSISTALSLNSNENSLQRAWATLIAEIDERDMTKIAAFQSVFEVCAAALARMPVNGAGLVELIEVLEGVSQSMSHWTYEKKRRVKNVDPQTWEIDHEYHVQSLLWTVLRPIFPDLVDEESLMKLGHTTPRYDLGVPSLHTIIEVKYMRRNGQAELRKITNEIAADRSLYLRDGTNYSKMIVFIWDEARQTEEYATLKSGLETLPGIERVILLPRPSKMERLNN